nr:FAD-dependent oxidoreductase [Enterococcus durans]
MARKLKLNDDGTIWVDDYLQTSAKNIYAIGDTIQVNFRPTEEKMYVSLVNNAIRTAHVVSRTISGKPTKDREPIVQWAIIGLAISRKRRDNRRRKHFLSPTNHKRVSNNSGFCYGSSASKDQDHPK